MIDYAMTGDTVTFDCPDDGPLVSAEPNAEMRTGYYSVMLGTLDPGDPLPSGSDVALEKMIPEDAKEPFATHNEYPASEEHVFTYREGGFFGSIFAPTSTRDSAACPAEQRLSGDQFACYSDIWTSSAAVFTARFCAGPADKTPSCFMNPPASCDPPSSSLKCDPPSGLASAPACDREAATGSPSTEPPPIVYDDCKYDHCKVGVAELGHPYTHPYTTYLNHPCDLFASDSDCTPFLGRIQGDLTARVLPIGPRAAPSTSHTSGTRP
jgi:hypothetical protein